MQRRDDPVAIDVVARHALDGDHRAAVCVVLLDQLLGDRLAAWVEHHVIREQDRERLIPDQLLRHQHRMAETELLLLVDEGDGADLRDATHHAQHLDVAALLQPRSSPG